MFYSYLFIDIIIILQYTQKTKSHGLIISSFF